LTQKNIEEINKHHYLTHRLATCIDDLFSPAKSQYLSHIHHKINISDRIKARFDDKKLPTSVVFLGLRGLRGVPTILHLTRQQP